MGENNSLTDVANKENIRPDGTHDICHFCGRLSLIVIHLFLGKFFRRPALSLPHCLGPGGSQRWATN